jgi:tripartite-type tricarboxylate transporter receptor subunit TctC
MSPPRAAFAGRRLMIEHGTRLSRRLFVAGSAGLAATAPWASSLAQDAYPSRPIKIVIGFGPGGLADITMRLLGEKLALSLGQPVYIENRPGAGGTVAAQSVMSAAPDGYSLAVLSIGTAMSVSLLKALPFDPTKDFLPVSTVAFYDLLLLVAANSPIKTLADLLAEAKKRGSAMNIGTINPGSSQNLAAELFKTAAGIDATIIPYRTTPEVQIALARGDVTVGVESFAALKGPIIDGALRPVASTGLKRSLPDVPTAIESGVNYDVLGWNALFVRAGTPQAIIDRLNKAIRDALDLPDLRQRIIDLGTEPRAMSPAELGALMKNDIVKWRAVIERAGLLPK